MMNSSDMKTVIEHYLEHGEHGHNFIASEVKYYKQSTKDSSIYNIVFKCTHNSLPVTRGFKVNALDLLLHINNIKYAR